MPEEERDRLLSVILAFAVSLMAALLWALCLDGAPVPPPRERKLHVPPRLADDTYLFELDGEGCYRAKYRLSSGWSWVGRWKLEGGRVVIKERGIDLAPCTPPSWFVFELKWRKGRWHYNGRPMEEVPKGGED